MSSLIPFRDMSPGKWLNLGRAALLLFYVAQVLLDVVWKNTCGHLGTDFCAFWAAGQLTAKYGFGAVYNLDLLRNFEVQNFISLGNPAGFVVSPIAYLPLFMAPFVPFSLLSPSAGFWLWSIINLTALVGYMIYFHQRTQSAPLNPRTLALLLLSLPVYWNLFNGQVNVWLTICLGESLRAAMDERPMRAGLWMGGLLLKPQSLILLVPVVLFRGSRRMIAGLLLSCCAVLGASLAMAGSTGAARMISVWLGFARGLPTNDIDSMMNWRMVGYYLSMWFSGPVGWAVIGAGMLLTALATVRLWRYQTFAATRDLSTPVLGTLAATGLMAWHSHVHMAMIMLPALLLVADENWAERRHVLERWTFIPAAAYGAVYVLAALVKLGILPGWMASSINVVRGGAMFGINLWILGLALRHRRLPSPPRVAPAPGNVPLSRSL